LWYWGNGKMASAKRIYAISDIHGCLQKLISLMGKLSPDLDTDRLIFLGDYIDRGPDPCLVVEYILDLKENHPDIVFLKGNHEKMFLDYLAGKERAFFLWNGGESTLRSYQKRYGKRDGKVFVPEEHLDFFRSLELLYETNEYIFVHAGLRPFVSLDQQKEEDLLWIRDEFIYSDYDFGKTVIFGHTPFPTPFFGEKKIGIDTGAAYGNTLTCLILPDREFISV